MSIKHQEIRPEPLEKVPESPAPVSETTSAPGGDDGPDIPEPVSEEFLADSESGKISQLEAELKALREELSTVNDKYLRKLAEDVNFRKRMTREKEDGQRFALTALLGDLIPILDDFDRAIASAETQKDYAVLHDGVLLIKRQLGSMLEAKYGLARYDSLGKPFDPNHHEAVAMVQGTDRILRTAKVRVRMPAPAASATNNDAN
jgi:molecular chaperone GrpE